MVALKHGALLTPTRQSEHAGHDGSGLVPRRVIMSCRIVNNTPFLLIPLHDYFVSGSYEADGVEPRLAYAFSSITFNLEDSPVSGVSGGLSMSAVLPRGVVIEFALGFTDPLFGKTKSGAAFSADPADGYNAASTEPTKIVAPEEATANFVREVGWPYRFVIKSKGKERCEWEVLLEVHDG